ncbi:MAG: hypothetical protein HYX96_07235 [Chloroflexi bacterium]|nr:hypothetical protein [Chloroflexota bacterium]
MKGIKLWQERKGISVVIGAIMMFTIMTGLYVSIQVVEVPAWNRQLEFEAFEAAYGDMLSLKADIGMVAIGGAPKSTAIRLGTRYPQRPFLANPGQGIAGSLTKEDATITVQYTIDFPGDPTFTETYTSNRLIYEVRGAIGAKIVYEHGLIIREFANGQVSTDTQPLVVGDYVYIPVLNASLFTPVSSVGAESIGLKPYTSSITKSKIKSATITLSTDYPDVWTERLEDTSTDKTSVSVNETAGTVSITSTATKVITLPAGSVTGSGLFIGIIILSTKSLAGFDPTADFPQIFNVNFEAIGNAQYKKTHTTITATVKNATAPYDIHADLTDLTSDVLKFDVAPTYSSPDSITAGSWAVPNSNTVKWEEITHPEFAPGEPVAVTFWIYNSALTQQYSMTSITVRLSGDNWR